MPRHHPGPDMPNFYSLSPGGVGQITPPLGWWVTDRQKQRHAQLINVNKEQLLSCLFTSDAHWHYSCFVYWMENRWPAAAATAYTGRSASGCSCCTAAAPATLAPLYAQHMSNTSPLTCPCITIWLLNPPSKLSGSTSLSEPHFMFVRNFFNIFFSFFLFWLHPCHCQSCAFFLFFIFPTHLPLLLSSSSLSLSLSVWCL